MAAAIAAAAPGPTSAQDAATDVSVSTSGGYARIVFRFNDDNDADVRISGAVLVISFKNPADVNLDRLVSAGADYISAARRDPDGKGLRVALTRQVTVNSMLVGDRLFVDLLPDTWEGPPPTLPQEVIDDLARRAREADKRLREERKSVERQPLSSRVRVARQPTFSRYIFELPELISVSAQRTDDKLTLVFDAAVKFDLADAKASLPSTVQAIEAVPAAAKTTVTFTFLGKSEIRNFREDNNYVVDVVAADAGKVSEIRRPQAQALGGDIPPRPESGANVAPSGLAVSVLEGRPAPTKPPPPAAAKAPPSAAIDMPKPPPANTTESAPPSEPAAGQAKADGEGLPSTPAAGAAVELHRLGDVVRFDFPFRAATPAAAFTRGDTFWLVFDTGEPVDLSALNGDAAIREAALTHNADTQIVRIKFERPRLISLSADQSTWTVRLGDVKGEATLPVAVNRTGATELQPTARIAFDDPRQLHRIEDPDTGDTLLVVTALGPARGILKPQDFVEFRALASIHGVAIQPIADDLNVELASDRIMIARPGGLTMSAAPGSRRSGNLRPAAFDTQLWGFDLHADFNNRLSKLIDAAARAPEAKRAAARLDLARFYFARGMYAEAKGVLDVLVSDDHPTAEDASGLVMRGVANLLIGRSEDGLRDLNNPLVGNQSDAPLWRAVASAQQGKWADAREGLRKTEVAVGTLPIELQRVVRKVMVRASIEVGDYAAAAAQLDEFETLGVTVDMEPALAILAGRIQQGLGRSADALASYRTAAASSDREVAAQGRLREISLNYEIGDLKRADVVADLETLTAIWRGDDTEVEALQMLAHFYTEDGRYRDAFTIMRTALKSHPSSDMTRRIQDEAAATFDALFLGGKGDAMPPVEALSLFYDFRELTPIGRRGDEMIRRLADRLVTLDLLDQAATLLQHQVDHRLQGAARAQVATRLAVIYLMSRKPDRALTVLKATRSAELSNELRNQRLLIEGRALTDIGRQNLALDVIESVEGPEAIRLRADILWAAKRYREAGEQIELLYGDRWRDFKPFSDVERRDILRAGVGYVLAEDQIGLGRLRDKFAAGMLQGPDRHAFEVITGADAGSGKEFRDIAHAIAAGDTLEDFLRDLKARFPENSAPSPVSIAPQQSTGHQSLLQLVDTTPTGSIPAPRPDRIGHTVRR